MHVSQVQRINKFASGRIYATLETDKGITLVDIGGYAEVRHRFNQVLCLVVALGQLRLEAIPPSTESRYEAQLGTWYRSDVCGLFGDADSHFQLASTGPSVAADIRGYQAYFDGGQWPTGMYTTLSGFKASVKSLSEISQLLYEPTEYPSIEKGKLHDISTVRRAQDAIKVAKSRGFTIFEEEKLTAFLTIIETASFMHFFHKI